VKISTLPSVNMIYFRLDNKLIPIFFIINQRRERMYWGGSGKISKLKNNFLQESLLLQPIMILIIVFCNLCVCVCVCIILPVGLLRDGTNIG